MKNRTVEKILLFGERYGGHSKTIDIRSFPTAEDAKKVLEQIKLLQNNRS